MAKKTIEARIKRIQSHLGISTDGLVGPATLTAIENAIFGKKAQITVADHHSLSVSISGLKKLVKHEISSNAYYKKFLSHPVWPGGHSGITIGIGYDLGYNDERQIRKDWSGKLSEMDLEKLVVISGLKGNTAKQALGGVKSVKVSLESAEAVFYESTLPRFAASTLKTYPGANKLYPDAQAGLLSLIYNRGTSLRGSRRKRMAAIKPLVTAQDYIGIAEQIRDMKVLWADKNLPGLLKRRDDEAKLIANSKKTYKDSDVVRV